MLCAVGGVFGSLWATVCSVLWGREQGQAIASGRAPPEGAAGAVAGVGVGAGHAQVMAERPGQVVGLVLEDAGGPAHVLLLHLPQAPVPEQLGGAQEHAARARDDGLPAVDRQTPLEGVDALR